MSSPLNFVSFTLTRSTCETQFPIAEVRTRYIRIVTITFLEISDAQSSSISEYNSFDSSYPLTTDIEIKVIDFFSTFI